MKSSGLLVSAALLFVLGVSILGFGIYRGMSLPRSGSGDPVEEKVEGLGADQPWLKEYELTERSERKIGTKDLAGKIHVVSFFFATCPGTCRQQNTHFADLEREFGKEGVKFVAITCDPETDDPAKLREYAELFNAPRDSWYFLTGNLGYTRRVAAEVYGVALDKKLHVERFVLVDRSGAIRGGYPWADAKKLLELKQDLRRLLAEETPPASDEPAPQKEDAQPTANDANESKATLDTP